VSNLTCVMDGSSMSLTCSVLLRSLCLQLEPLNAGKTLYDVGLC